MARVAADVALAEARRDIHELLYSLPAWDADKVRDKLAALEQAVREKIAADIEKSEFQRGPFSGSNHYLGGYTDAIADAARVARGGN